MPRPQVVVIGKTPLTGGGERSPPPTTVTLGSSSESPKLKPDPQPPKPLNVGVFVDTATPVGGAIYQGVKAAGDHASGRNVQCWKRNEFEAFDTVIFMGIPPAAEEAVAMYRELLTPIFFVELGHIKRACNSHQTDKYYQLCVNALASIATDLCSDDRRLALGVERPKTYKKQGGYILLLGQKPGDAQHDIRDMIGWKTRQCKAIQEVTDRPIKFRKHPKDLNPRESASTNTLEQDFEGAWAVVTHNSNAGLKALMYGLPVVADPSAFFAPICQDLANIDKPKAVKKKDFESLFNRIAYSQWLPSELVTGEPWRRIKQCCLAS